MVLEGGAMRGIFSSGVLDALMEREIYTSYVVGVSAGSCNGVDYVSRQIGRSRDCIAVEDKSIRYVHTDPVSILKGRALDMEMLCDKYPNHYFPFDYDTYFQSEMRCEVVATDVETGKAAYLSETSDKKRLMDIISASCSMPVINKLYEVDGRLYTDGGVSDSVPIIHAMEEGHRKLVLVLTRQKGYRKKGKKSIDFIYRRLYKKYPALVEALTGRPRMYNRTMDLIDKWESEGKIFVFRPEVPDVKHMEQDCATLLAYYQHGVEQAEARIDELIAYLES